jgi:transglutaminase-like putative cysteine protease
VKTGDDGLHRGAEVALGVVTLAAIAGLGRLFADGSYLGPLALHAALAHLFVAVLRRRNVNLGVAAVLTAVGAAVAVGAIHYPSTTALLLPTGETWRAASDDLGRSWDLFQDVVAPAPVETGFLVATAVTLWFVAFTADWAAFRLWVPFEATLPAATLFVFGSLLGADEKRVSSAAAFAGSVIVFLLVHRVLRQGRSVHWVGDADGRGRRSMVATGAVLAAVAVVVAGAGGPLLPGAQADAVIDWNPDGPDRRVTVSPLVDIRTRLVDQGDVEVFRVRSPQRAYWRMTSLDEFDGRIWSSSGSYGRADGGLDSGVESRAPATEVTQHVTMQALAAIWLPAAYEPAEIDATGADIRYDEVSATLIVDQQHETSDGVVYDVVSRVPALTADDFAGVGPSVPGDIADRYLPLPADMPGSVRALAEELTSDTTTPYAKALALQAHFRGGRFTYDLNVGPGHSTDALEGFLFETRRGYCEQFAGAYAAMARAVGLPARVAVGFTPGETVSGAPGEFSVRGENAHAWPEVYMDGLGWVAFEPTPGRGAPGAESYTGIPEQQAAPGDSNVATTLGGGGETPITPSTVDPSATTAPSSVPTAPDQGIDVGPGGAPTQEPSFVERAGIGIVWLLGAAALVALLYVAAVVVVRDGRRRARRRAASTPTSGVQLAAVQVTEVAQLLGLDRLDDETHWEYARRLRRTLPELDGDLGTLFEALVVADYAPDGVAADEAEAAGAAAERIVAAVTGYAGWRRVAREELRWHHLVGEHAARRRAAAPVRGTSSPSGLVAAEAVSHATAGVAE